MVTTLILTSKWIRIYGLIKSIENLIFIQKYIFSLLCTISIWIDWLISGGECLVQSILQKVRQIYRITVYWPNHLTYTHIYIYNFEIQWDRYIVWLSLASRRLYNILYFMWLYNEFFIILYNILKIAELDCCQIIILSIYVPSTHAYTHVLPLSLDLPYEKR